MKKQFLNFGLTFIEICNENLNILYNKQYCKIIQI